MKNIPPQKQTNNNNNNNNKKQSYEVLIRHRRLVTWKVKFRSKKTQGRRPQASSVTHQTLSLNIIFDVRSTASAMDDRVPSWDENEFVYEPAMHRYGKRENKFEL